MSAMPEFAMTYVVWWPDAGVLKVGRAWRMNRIRQMVESGAHVIVCQDGTDATWEREALQVLSRWFPKAFDCEEQSRPLLEGGGWTECFLVAEHDLNFALDLCVKGFARGNDRGVNEATNDQRRGSAVARVSGRPGRGEADRARPVDSARRDGQGPDGRALDSARAVPRSSAEHGGGDGDRAPADDARGRVPDDVQGGGGGVDSAAPAVEGGQAARADRYPRAATRDMDVRGCRERERAGGRESAGEARERGERGGVGERTRGPGETRTSRTTSRPGCAAHRLPEAPRRSRLCTLRPLRDCSRAAHEVDGGAYLRGTPGDVLREHAGARGGRR